MKHLDEMVLDKDFDEEDLDLGKATGAKRCLACYFFECRCTLGYNKKNRFLDDIDEVDSE